METNHSIQDQRTFISPEGQGHHLATNGAAAIERSREKQLPEIESQSEVGAHSQQNSLKLWARARRVLSDFQRATWVQQLLHTILVLLVSLAMWVPMLAVQTVLKNAAMAYIRSPRPDLAELNRTLPDVLLDHWPQHQFCIINYLATTQMVWVLKS